MTAPGGIPSFRNLLYTKSVLSALSLIAYSTMEQRHTIQSSKTNLFNQILDFGRNKEQKMCLLRIFEVNLVKKK